MRIAISSARDGWDARFEERFGRARGFLVHDTDTEETSFLDMGANAEAPHGAGTRTARAIVEAKVDVVVTGRVGPKAGAVLEAAGIGVRIGAGSASAEEAYRRYRSGELEESRS
jgi:predicted Fe-Mo cluster-binding NifX family protein